MTIQAVYDQYQIMPALQRHQYRVAAVAKVIAEASSSFSTQDIDEVVAACLLHDMGNILKFDLTMFPDFLAPLGLEYWTQVQNEYRQKYGDDEYEATLKILDELNVSDRVKELVKSIGFVNLVELKTTFDLSPKICEYADCRVAPTGVVSLAERLDDFENRYGGIYSTPTDVERRRRFREVIEEVEAEIFKKLTLRPEDINEVFIHSLIPELSKSHLS